jgi:putative transposase
VDEKNQEITVKKQCELLEISRSTYYYKCRTEEEDQGVEDLKLILAVLKEIPFYGYRKISKQLQGDHPHLTRKRVRRIMKKFGLRAIYAKRNLSKARQEHKKYPYLLRGKQIRHPNQVWASDITYIRLASGYVYLVVIIDLFSRKVLTWRISNTLDAEFCIAALEEAIEEFGIPAIFNSDQGVQYTSDAFISVLESYNIQISMDGKGRALDNIYVERLWRTLKYEDIYLKSYETVGELRAGLSRYFKFYNTKRFHQSHDYLTPEIMYESFSVREELRMVA